MALQNGRKSAGGLMKDFQAFILQGSVIDLAVAVIIGGAFGKIVTSLIEDIIHYPFAPKSRSQSCQCR